MAFYNKCCRENLDGIADATSGERHECAICGNDFIYDGERWRNVLELGMRKVEKLTTIRRIHQLTRGLD